MYYKISVIDDSPSDTQYVAALAAQWAESAGHEAHICVFPSAEAFLFQYEEEQDFDVLLLDIEMGTMNGVDLAKKNPPAKQYDTNRLYHGLSRFYCGRV